MQVENESLKNEIDSLKKSENFHRIIIENLPTIISVYDENEFCTKISPSLNSLTGYLQENFINKKFEEFDKIEANLGSTVNMRVRYHFTTAKGITTTMQGVNQNLHPLVVDDAYTTGIAINDFVFTASFTASALFFPGIACF